MWSFSAGCFVFLNRLTCGFVRLNCKAGVPTNAFRTVLSIKSGAKPLV
jgi:hypothetical protein